MIWNKHFSLEGQHAFLSPSQYAWLNYDDDKLIDRFQNLQAAKRGSEIHELAAPAIKHKIQMPNDNKTINAYINDGIKYRMDPEVLLYYSRWCFGTADSLSCRILVAETLRERVSPDYHGFCDSGDKMLER